MTQDTRGDHPVSRLDLELLALGKLPPEAAADIEARAAQDPELAARVARIREEIDDAAHDLPALRLPFEEEEEAAEGSFWTSWMRWTPFVLAGAMAAAMALLSINSGGPSEDPGRGEVRFRGALDLKVWRVHEGQAQEEDGLIEAAAGDRIQYEVASDTKAWLSVFNVQDDGQLSTYLAPTELSPLTPKKAAVLLDDYKGSERIFFVLDEQPVTEDAAAAALEKAWDAPLAELDALPGLKGAQQRSVLVVKP